MDDDIVNATSSQESLPLSQETFQYIWDTCLLEGLENMDNSQFDSSSITESNFNADMVPLEPILVSTSVVASQNPVSSSISFAPSSLPASQNWAGLHDFNVSFGPQEKTTKGVSWTYSKEKDKLYVGKDAPCPINFSATIPMSDVSIRAMALYSSPESASEVVHRCVNHSMEELTKGVFEAEHLIRCESNMASYEIDQTTKRHSVVVPFETPPAGQSFSTYIFKFACFGSCAGGPNRRPIMLIFSLEKGGRCVGRRRLDVKICACPGRDRKAEEQQLNAPAGGQLPVKRKESEMVTLADTFEFTRSIMLPPSKKIKHTPHDGVYTIKTEDKAQYEFLKQMKKFYEMCKTMSNLSPNIKKVLAYHSSRRRGGSSSQDPDSN